MHTLFFPALRQREIDVVARPPHHAGDDIAGLQLYPAPELIGLYARRLLWEDLSVNLVRDPLPLRPNRYEPRAPFGSVLTIHLAERYWLAQFF
jgi:hypothetical protein